MCIDLMLPTNHLQARGYRLGAMQRKFPLLGIALLYLLAGVELLAFPLLGAGTANSVGILSLQESWSVVAIEISRTPTRTPGGGASANTRRVGFGRA